MRLQSTNQWNKQIDDNFVNVNCQMMTWRDISSHYRVWKCSLTWNQMALTILLRTNRGRTQRALKTEVRMNSSQDQTLVWREGSPWIKKNRKKFIYWLLSSKGFNWQILFNFQQQPHIPMIIAVRDCSKGMNTWLKTKRLSCRKRKWNRLLLNSCFHTSYITFWNLDDKKWIWPQTKRKRPKYKNKMWKNFWSFVKADMKNDHIPADDLLLHAPGGRGWWNIRPVLACACFSICSDIYLHSVAAWWPCTRMASDK